MSKLGIDRIMTQARHARQQRERVPAEALATNPLLQAQEARETIKRTLKALDRWIARKNDPATWGRAADLNHLADQLTELAHERHIEVAARRRS
jgi:hypothetical protein